MTQEMICDTLDELMIWVIGRKILKTKTYNIRVIYEIKLP